MATNGRCACGRGLPLIKRFEGRSFDVIECPNGRRVAGTYWTIAMRRVEGVQQFQVVQDAADHIRIRLRADKRRRSDTERAVNSLVQEACGDGMSVSYEYVDKIDLSASGKQRLVIRDYED